MRRSISVMAALVMALVAAACGSGSAGPSAPSQEVASPFAACDAFLGTAATPAPVKGLPDVELPCFTGGAKVRTGALRGPLVITFWASTCLPCRTELPAFQRLADRKIVPVLGVDTIDSRAAGASLGTDLGVTFPTLFDQSGAFLHGLGRATLPVTVVVDAAGRATVHDRSALTDETLAVLIQQNLGLD